MNSSSQYRHFALSSTSKQIRLLTISRSLPGHPISCDLTAHFVANLPPYVALSYTWGPPEELENSQEQNHNEIIYVGSQPFAITLNLFHALRELTHRAANKADTLLPLWIDAVCIDQQNIGERNEQVALMDVIYSCARKVLVWMGEDKRDEATLVRDMHSKFVIMDRLVCELAVELFKAGRKEFEFHKSERIESINGVIIDKLRIVRRYPIVLLDAAGLPPIHDERWEILLSFYRRRWFSRIWILQEVALAKKLEVWFGHETLTWAGILACSSILNGAVENLLIMRNFLKRSSNYSVFDSVKALVIVSIREWYTTGTLFSLDWPAYHLLTGSRQVDVQTASLCIFMKAMQFEASKPLDKVFGLLGILKRLSGSENTLVDVDYEHDQRLVFTNVTRAILQQTNWLGYLCNITPHREKRCSGLPSWVVDPNQKALALLVTHGDPGFNIAGHWASSAGKRTPDLVFHGNILTVYGIKLAAIDGKSEHLDGFLSNESDFEEGAKLFLARPVTHQRTNEALVETLWRTLILNKLDDIPVEKWRQAFKCWWLCRLLTRAEAQISNGYSMSGYLQTIPNTLLLAEEDRTGILSTRYQISNIWKNIVEGEPPVKSSLSEFIHFSDAVGEFSIGRRMFGTDGGFFGLGPAELEIGDEVWIMARSQVPFVLRKSSNDNPSNRFRFVGECYIHGIMYGEYFDDTESPQWEAIDLE